MLTTLLVAILPIHRAAWPAATPGGAYRIHGRVAAGDLTQPVANAVVYLWMPAKRRSTTVRTGEDGRYAFTGLGAGSYHLRVRHPAYIERAHGSTRRSTWSPNIALSASRPVREANFQLEKGASISGRVLRADGTGVVSSYVCAVPLESGGDLPRWWGRLYNRTDPTGKYTLNGVAVGRYVLAAVLPESTATAFGLDRAVCYHPAGLSPVQATRLSVTQGQNLTGVDVQVRPTPNPRLSGTVVDAESGLPIPRAKIHVIHRETTPHRIEAETGPDGAFAIRLLGPGPYQVLADARGQGFARESKWIDLAQSGPPAEVHLQLPLGVSLSGNLRLDTGESLPRTRRLYGYAQPPANKVTQRAGHSVYNMRGLTYVQEGPQPERIRFDDDLSFSVDAACPGQVSLALSNLPQGYYVRSIRSPDFNITARPPELQPGQELGGITVLVSNRHGKVAGRLAYERSNRPAARWRVYTTWSGTTNRSSDYGRADARGEFVLDQVPLGKHALAVSTSSSYKLKTVPTFVVRADRTTRIEGVLISKRNRSKR